MEQDLVSEEMHLVTNLVAAVNSECYTDAGR